MNAKIKQIEKVLGTKLDGVWDDRDQKALDALSASPAKKGPPPLAAPQVTQVPGGQPQTYM